MDSISPLFKHDIATKRPRRIRQLESGSDMTIDSKRSSRVDEMGTLTSGEVSDVELQDLTPFLAADSDFW